MKLLPTSATRFFSHEEQQQIVADHRCGWHGVLSALLLAGGTQSIPPMTNTTNGKLCAFSMLKDSNILAQIMAYVGNPYLDHVRLTIPAPLIGASHYGLMKFTSGRAGHPDYLEEDSDDENNDYKQEENSNGGGDTTMNESNHNNNSEQQQKGYVAFCKCGNVTFPPPHHRNVNMLPFRLGNKASLPDNLQCYHDMIEACPYVREEIGNVAYLTVHESNHVPQGTTQRRPGLHIESPGVFRDAAKNDQDGEPWFYPAQEHHWGVGIFYNADRYEGGIYIASSQSGTTQVWDALIDSSVPGIVERGGGCGHLRPWIGQGTTLEAGELVWLTDRTPHENMKQQQGGPRQFFRLVMPHVSHWYADHSTSNPRCPLPPHVTVVHGDKFKAHHGIESDSAKKPAVTVT
mmetsp:Transcript_2022/g.4911  ORF Transcript_2022/g.4911 Transcript_2022/m.4911 type:complete len:403 (+) Transcript_2022:263-1471(+)|eukprot:CAMPEP_0168818150 /NCGR_PEP_ID=MMETSP0726-20121227/7608_1 /TAXON_ID=265536 /ORGANISM="Amphiprora sp., Strain CCMP467" /LENGTH=402 /DNA_ID=CAMNT_0008870467 /DNA_START=153 /DNA_END=1361 /DNA_ORIENTATION=-